MNLFFLKQTKPSAGFTLIELLVVIAIIGILASTVLASLGSARSSARDARRLSETKQLQTALELYRNSNNNQYPCANSTTDNGGCASFGAAAPVNLNHPTNRNTTFLGLINFEPTQETPATLLYRLRSTTNNNNNPDRTSYTILVKLERNTTWCSINYGIGHSLWNGSDTNYPPCF